MPAFSDAALGCQTICKSCGLVVARACTLHFILQCLLALHPGSSWRRTHSLLLLGEWSASRISALVMQVYPHGSTDALPFCTMGSGSLNAMAVFESGYKDDLSREEAVELVANAIKAGIYNDLGSGSNVDICVITKGKVDYMRNHEYLQDKTYQRRHPVTYGKGTTSTPLPIARNE